MTPVVVRRKGRMKRRFTICVVIAEVVVQDEALDPLLLLSLLLLLAAHGNGKVGI
jgi:hypothetical protein